MTTRRGFLTGILTLGAAPAVVRAASLMRTVTPAGLVWNGEPRIIRFADLDPLYQQHIDTLSYQIGENMALMREMIIAKVIRDGR